MRSLIQPLRGSTLRVAFGTLLLVLAAASLSTAPPSAATTTLCVGGQPGCFASIQAALDAAQDGDTIEIASGTFAGGITIDKSVSLVGVSAGATTIEAAGP
jgi:pectin methylesterase-like acyl-CoA thioesterase